MNRVTVEIAGFTYSLSGTESIEHIMRLAGIVSDQVLKSSDGDISGNIARDKALVIAAINIADEMLREQQKSKAVYEENEALKQDINEFEDKIKALSASAEQKDKELDAAKLALKNYDARTDEKTAEYKQLAENTLERFYDLQLELAEKTEKLELYDAKFKENSKSAAKEVTPEAKSEPKADKNETAQGKAVKIEEKNQLSFDEKTKPAAEHQAIKQ